MVAALKTMLFTPEKLIPPRLSESMTVYLPDPYSVMLSARA